MIWETEEPVCNDELRSYLDHIIVSLGTGKDQFACSINELEGIISSVAQHPVIESAYGEDDQLYCGPDCWRYLQDRRDYAYKRWNFYREHLDWAEAIYAEYFLDCQ